MPSLQLLQARGCGPSYTSPHSPAIHPKRAAHDRRQPHGDCLILTYWDTTSKLLADPFNGVRDLRRPSLLHNIQSPLPLQLQQRWRPDPAFLAAGRRPRAPFNDPQMKAMRAQINEIRNGATATGERVERSSQQTSQVNIFQGISALGAIVSSSRRRASINLSKPSPERTYLYVSQLQDLNEQIRAKQNVVSKAKDQVATLTKHVSPALSIHQCRALWTSTQEEEDVEMNLVVQLRGAGLPPARMKCPVSWQEEWYNERNRR
ncbi:hypothetical protein C8R46DRAFT_1039184 [Mycena filopes]|nr:hypothetical protein C8R46DRAFT_1039184 [Mycena filopes]